MIIQTNIEGKPNFVIEQADHARMSGQLSEAFGNDSFAAPVPHDLLAYIVAHHDEGWVSVDALREQSPETGLPHHLTQTPLPYLVKTSKASPDFNEAHHAFCGLLSSMHTYGLFNGRYGLSDFIFIDKIAADNKQAVTDMLEEELERQDRLKKQLASDSESAAWVEEAALMNNYKLLQFFDTLSLYFHMAHAKSRGESKFLNVPDGKGTDHTLSINPTDDGAYALSPYPFKDDSIEISVEGRYLTSQPEGTDFKAIFDNTAKEKQVYRLVKG
jgi:hypothetical protein